MRAKKIIFIGLGLLVLLAIVGFSLSQTQKNLVTVQTGHVVKQEISSTVTASGEVKPQTYVNVGANAFGRITKLFVKEGDKVKRGQMLATLENVQSAADVAAMRAQLESNQTDAVAADAALKTSLAALNSSRADAARTKLEFDRAQGLYDAKLIAKADYDTKKAAYEVASSTVAQDQARVAQARAQLDSAQGHIGQSKAQLTHASDVLSKTVYTAPFDGVVTYLPVREGETVVVGIQNSPGSTLMTLADLNVITAEVFVDETDIVNVQLHQQAEVTIDAIPGKTFKGEVTQIGDNAIIRSSGIATSQSTASSQEAKDFKVVITLKDPPLKIRPGLSATAKITTGTKGDALTIPIQAIAMRKPSELEAPAAPKAKDAADQQPKPEQAKKKEDDVQGVFVVLPNKKVEFRKVETGITGATDIEIKSGLKEGEEIVTGSFKVLRSIRNGAPVKVDNSIATKQES